MVLLILYLLGCADMSNPTGNNPHVTGYGEWIMAWQATLISITVNGHWDQLIVDRRFCKMARRRQTRLVGKRGRRMAIPRLSLTSGANILPPGAKP